MAVSGTIQVSGSGGQAFSGVKTYTGDSRISYSFTIDDGQSDQRRTVNIDVSELQCVVITSDQDILMEWNDAAGTQGSINLKADVPFEERVAADQYHAAKLAVDITDFYWTNTSGSNAVIKIEGIQNNTP